MPATRPLPELAVNFALTWDCRATTRNRSRADFSTPGDKRRLLQIRAGADAVMAGRGTVIAENMRMRVPDAEFQAARTAQHLPPEPLRVIVSAFGALDPEWPIFQTPEGAPVIVFSTQQMPASVRTALEGKATVYLLGETALDLRAMLQTLADRHGVRRIICEGGPGLLRSLLAANLVDELNVTFCPLIFGGLEAPSLTGGRGEFLPKSINCRLESLELLGEEAFACYRVIK